VQGGQIKLTEMMRLVERFNQLEQKLNGKQKLRQHQMQRRRGRPWEVICRICKQPGHYARGCAVRRSQSPTKGTSTPSEAHECIDSVPRSDAQTITINSVSNYSVPAVVFDSQVLFLVDTGAAVSLISKEIWDHIKPADPPELKPVNMRLVGVEGTSMQIQGSTAVNLKISKPQF